MTSPAGLRADCGSCFGLCCVVPAFAASSDFAIGKPAGRPCVNLLADHRCGIHAELRERGFAGCTVFDCFGAGQRVARDTFGGRDWRDHPDLRVQMFAAFPVVRQLHELLWYLTQARSLDAAAPLHGDLTQALADVDAAAGADAPTLAALDVGALREAVNDLLLRTSELVRAAGDRGDAGPGHGRDARAGRDGTGRAPKALRRVRRGADLVGADLRGADLRRRDLRGAYLLGADLRRADLRTADLIGADLRGADVRGADLREALFLTQFQLNATRGDAATRIPPTLTRPAHWTT